MRQLPVILLATLLVGTTLLAEPQWPISIETNGSHITIFQLQPDKFEDGVLVARSALSIVPVGQSNAVYGVMHIEARAISNTNTQTVVLKDLHVPNVRVSGLPRAQELQYTATLSSEASKWSIEFPQDTLNAMLELAASTDSEPLEKELPRTASVPRGKRLEVTYDGPPRFEPIEQTRLHYAVNTAYQVVKDGDRYYCADRGIWYAAEQPQGPWQTTDRIPDEIRNIPPTSPVYNTRFLYVGDRSDETIHYGFYPGYLRGAACGTRLWGWGVDYESPDYSIRVDPLGGSLYYREKSTTGPKKKKNWGRDTSKFPEFEE